MFCPSCKGEYRPGFTHCFDCDVDLIPNPPKADAGANGDPPESSLQQVWNGGDQGDCLDVCTLLKESRIPYKVFQQREQFWKKVEEAYRVAVPLAFAGRAKQLIDDDADRRKLEPVEWPADGTEVPEEDGDWDPDKWDPRTATARLWSGQNSDEAIMIASSLGENHIHCRTETLGDGSQRIFVEPANESRAREIVREIETGSS